MRRKAMLVTAWMGATAVATLVAWGAVSQVADQVVPSGALPMPSAAAVAAPAQPSATAEPTEPSGGPAARSVGYDLVGGTVTVRYRGTTTRLVQASPNSGFAVDVGDGGPDKVEVRFRSDRHESRLVAQVSGGRPDVDRDERPR